MESAGRENRAKRTRKRAKIYDRPSIGGMQRQIDEPGEPVMPLIEVRLFPALVSLNDCIV
jgi:hypothetical protein